MKVTFLLQERTNYFTKRGYNERGKRENEKIIVEAEMSQAKKTVMVSVVSLAMALVMVASVFLMVWKQIGVYAGEVSEGQVIDILNPYEGIDFSTTKQYKANLHTHTTDSDGGSSQKDMFVMYQKERYDFLAFADHDYYQSLWPNYAINDGKTYGEDESSSLGGTSGLDPIPADPDRNLPEWKTSDVLAIKGQEVSKTGWENHHFGNYFSDFLSDGTAKNITELVKQAAAYDEEGLQVIFHPGRYVYREYYQRYVNPQADEWSPLNNEKFWNLPDDYEGWDPNAEGFNKDKARFMDLDPIVRDTIIDTYVDLYMSTPTLVGMEVINYQDIYYDDRMVWDAVLTETMPYRPVWGFANDDSHGTGVSEVYLNMEFMLLQEKTVEDFKDAMVNGNFFFGSYVSNHEEGMSGGEAGLVNEVQTKKDLPKFTNLIVDEENNTITIECENIADAEMNGNMPIQWISCGKEVGTGATIDLTNPEIDKYVRAVISGDGGQMYTQPIGIVKSTGESAEIKNAQAKIDAIGDVITPESGDKIREARETFEALCANQKKLVNTEKLVKAEEKYAEITASDIGSVIDKIAQISEDVTLGDEVLINRAREAYDKLTADQKKQVTNYSKLESAEKTLADLKNTTENGCKSSALYACLPVALLGILTAAFLIRKRKKSV